MEQEPATGAEVIFISWDSECPFLEKQAGRLDQHSQTTSAPFTKAAVVHAIHQSLPSSLPASPTPFSATWIGKEALWPGDSGSWCKRLEWGPAVGWPIVCLLPNLRGHPSGLQAQSLVENISKDLGEA